MRQIKEEVAAGPAADRDWGDFAMNVASFHLPLRRALQIAIFLAVGGAGVSAWQQDPVAGGVDRYGDPLPPRAIARLGTTRLRHAGADNSHGASVTCLAYAPDGKSVASGGGDGTVRLWEVQSGREILRLRGHQGPISSIAYSPDGTRLVSGGGDTMVFSRKWGDGDRTVRVWELASGRELKSLAGHQRGVTAVAFSPDGKRVASGCLDETVRVWDAASGEAIATLGGYSGGVSSLYFSSDGQSLLSADGAHLMRTQEIAGGREGIRVQLNGRKGKWPGVDVSNIAPSADGRTIVSVDGSFPDKAVRLWDASTGKERPVSWAVDRGSGVGCIYAGLFSPDGKVLATRGGAGGLHLWSVATGAKLHELLGHEYDVLAFAYSPDGRILASGGDDRSIRFWDTSTGKEIEKAQAHNAWVDGVAFSPDGKTVATIGGDAKLRLWDPATGRPLHKINLPGRQNWGKHVVYLPDGKRLAASGRDGAVHFWEAATGGYVRGWSGIPPEIHGVGLVDAFAISPEGTILAVSCFETVRLLDIATGKEVLRLKGPTGMPAWMSFSPDGRLLFTTGPADLAARTNVLAIWDRASGARLLAAALDDKAWPRAALSSDGRMLAISQGNGAVGLWEVASGKEVVRLAGHPKMTTALAFSPAGTLLATGGYDSLVRVWDVADGRERAKLEGHAEHVASAAFSPDGKTLASVSSDTTGLVWDLASIAPETAAVDVGGRDLLFAALSETTDASKAYQAMAAFSHAGDPVVPYLQDRLLRPSPDLKRTRELLEALDHADIGERAKAGDELERSGRESLLRQALRENPSAEVRARLESILKGFEGPCPRSGETLRSIRVIQVLERIGTGAARAALGEIAGAQPQSRGGREAKAALDRARR